MQTLGTRWSSRIPERPSAKGVPKLFDSGLRNTPRTARRVPPVVHSSNTTKQVAGELLARPEPPMFGRVWDMPVGALSATAVPLIGVVLDRAWM